MAENNRYVRWLDDLTNDDVPVVGGKNASLGEMIESLKEQGVRVPGGCQPRESGWRGWNSSSTARSKSTRWP